MSGAKKTKQGSLFSTQELGPLEHGGDLNRGKRKRARPFSPDAPIHIVLKSDRAHGRDSLLHRRNSSHVETLIFQQAARAGVKIYRHANAGSHIHLLIRAYSRSAYQKFLRALSGLISRHVDQTRRGKPSSLGRFWSSIPYSRLIHWGREFHLLCTYIAKNKLEAYGFMGARVRVTPQGERVIVVGDPHFRPGAQGPAGDVEAYLRRIQQRPAGDSEE